MKQATRKRPGGRNEAVRAAVAKAVLDTIEEHGFDFSYVDIAERAGVHHTTVYRRWPTKMELLREAMRGQYSRLEIVNTGSFVSDLHLTCQSLSAYLAEPVQRAVFGQAIVSESSDVADLLREYWFPLRAKLKTLVRKAVEAGQLTVDTDPSTFVQLLIGPLALEPLFTRKKLQKKQVEKIVDTILRSHSCPALQMHSVPHTGTQAHGKSR